MSAAALISRVRAILLDGAEGKRAQRLASLIDSAAFANVAEGVHAAGDDAETRLALLVTWLDMVSGILNLTDNNGRRICDDIHPQELLGHIRDNQSTHNRNVEALRQIAASLTPKHSEPLNRLANQIAADRFAIKGHGIPGELVSFLLSEDNIGESGAAASSAANPQGTWRGWIIRSLYDQLPPLGKEQKPWATMRDLLTWAGLDGVESYDVASIITRKRRRRS